MRVGSQLKITAIQFGKRTTALDPEFDVNTRLPVLCNNPALFCRSSFRFGAPETNVECFSYSSYCQLCVLLISGTGYQLLLINAHVEFHVLLYAVLDAT